MDELDFSPLAKESLDIFEEISHTAGTELARGVGIHITDSFASGNSLTGAVAYKNLAEIHQEQREALEKLCVEPAIVRLVLEDENENQRILYILRAVATWLCLPQLGLPVIVPQWGVSRRYHRERKPAFTFKAWSNDI